MGSRSQYSRICRSHAEVAAERPACLHHQSARWKPRGIFSRATLDQHRSSRRWLVARGRHAAAGADFGSGGRSRYGRDRRHFYFGQDQRVRDEEAVKRAVQSTVKWIVEEQGYTNVLLEIDNECDVRAYHHEILKPGRVHELILLAKDTSRRILAGTSFGGGSIPSPNVVKASDFILLHGNGVADPGRISEMVRKTRGVEGYRPMPILFNEDDHFDFDKPANNMLAAIGEYASWVTLIRARPITKTATNAHR